MSEDSPISYASPTQETQSFDVGKKKNRHYLRRFLIGFVIVLALLIILLITAVFFYFLPLKPTVQLVSTDVKNLSLVGSSSRPTPAVDGSNWTAFALQAELLLRLKIKNRYHFGFTLDKTELSLLVGKGHHKIGEGTAENLQVEKRSEVAFNFPIDIHVGLASPAGREIVLQCTKKRFVNVEVPVQSKLRFGKLTIRLRFVQSHQMSCKQILSLIS